MEKTNNLSWEERHPHGDLSYHTFLDVFEGATNLGQIETKVALRNLKYHLEEKLGSELSDDAFLAIFFKVIRLHPARPLGGWSFQSGYVMPMEKILTEYNLHCEVKDIFDFFRVKTEDDRHYNNILLHIPHSSTLFPKNTHYTFDDLDNEEHLLIDYYTDELFAPEKDSKRISSIVFPYCRLYCDVERLINDPLEKEGLGISYSRWVPKDNYSKSLRSFSTLSSAFDLYADHHSTMSKEIVSSMGSLLLIDCHSFSSLPNLLNSNPPDIDICIGFNVDETCPNKIVIDNIVQHFKSHGYKVGINEPFSNSKTFAVPVQYHSVMIEVNKRLYMDELTMEKTEGFYKLRQEIRALYDLLIKG